MSDTPRTDAAVNEVGKSGVDWHYSATIMSNVARQLERENAKLRECLKAAVSAGEYVVKLCEANTNAGVSPNPFEKADWVGTVAHCYAAMNFLSAARKALAEDKQ